ncbi:peptidoglycan-binding protein [Hoeflea sp. TYP-13]|uniref:peptidoglycan-binding protein n=1 Tax=Hoeflea sp. TYP-13 TaxID=3230023 RepID=UPI0034C65EBE
MTRRKRPDAKTGRFPVLTGLLRSAGESISRHPSIAGGATVFAVAFTFVTINALVYQPGKHPAPLYNTRTTSGYNVRIPALEDVPIPSSRVTTFRIEHSDPQSTASIPDRKAPPADITVYNLQSAMRARGLYNGTVDGVFGPQTANSIRNYQKGQGLEPTGEPTDALLVHLLISDLDVVAVPRPKPGTVTEILKAEKPAQAPRAAAEDPVADLIVSIQKGLSNIAYDDVKVDGVIGRQTTEAIADFQRHYRLPVTGQPDKLVLKKLREIGAL